VWPTLSALDNLVVATWQRAGGARRLRTPARVRRFAVQPSVRLLDSLGLSTVVTTPAGRLSHGQRRLLEIAIALAGTPRLLLLDEPAAGLSPEEIERLAAILVALPPTVTLLLVEHHLELVYSLSDTVTVLRAGRHVATGTPGEIRRSTAVAKAYAGAVS
jgi:branched-chain amino acid transport system ATP-binding protein